MVSNDGQLYTIEGIAAGLIMLFTAYLVVNATSVYTPGDTHISDLQLEQTGTDALRMMNMQVNGTVAKSPLQDIVETSRNNPTAAETAFNTAFLNYCNNRTGGKMDNLHYNANITYYHSDVINSINTTKSLPLASNRNLTGGEHPVRVTEWVIADKPFPGSVDHPRAVLVEVLLWRD